MRFRVSSRILRFSILHSHQYFEFWSFYTVSHSVYTHPCLRVEKISNLIGRIFYFKKSENFDWLTVTCNLESKIVGKRCWPGLFGLEIPVYVFLRACKMLLPCKIFLHAFLLTLCFFACVVGVFFEFLIEKWMLLFFWLFYFGILHCVDISVLHVLLFILLIDFLFFCIVWAFPCLLYFL